MRKKPASNGQGSLTRSQVAEMAGLSASRISQMAADGTLAQLPDGRFPTFQTARTLIGYYRSKGGDLSMLAQEEKRKKIELLDIEIGKAHGVLIRTEVIRPLWEEFILITRQKLLNVAGKVAPRLAFCRAEYEFQKAIDDEIREALLELSRFDGVAVKTEEVPEPPIDKTAEAPNAR